MMLGGQGKGPPVGRTSILETHYGLGEEMWWWYGEVRKPASSLSPLVINIALGGQRNVAISVSVQEEGMVCVFCPPISSTPAAQSIIGRPS